MTRRNARERAVQVLFQMDINPGDIDSALDWFWEDKEPDAKTRHFTEDVVRGVLQHQKKIDSMMQNYADHWALDRMGTVDRNIIRIAIYEMLFRRDIPPVVSINEAVDIAKQFSSKEAGRFVNGILDRARKDLNRPDREPTPENSVEQRKMING